MERGFLFPVIRRKVKELLHGYVVSPVFAGELEGIHRPAGTGQARRSAGCPGDGRGSPGGIPTANPILLM